jgi:hypothetical protein
MKTFVGWRYSSSILNLDINEINDKLQAPAALLLGKDLW